MLAARGQNQLTVRSICRASSYVVNGWIESSPRIAKDVGLSCLRDMAGQYSESDYIGDTPNRSISKEHPCPTRPAIRGSLLFRPACPGSTASDIRSSGREWDSSHTSSLRPPSPTLAD